MIQFRVLYSLDLLGTVTFAISGTLLAIERQQKGYLASFLDLPRALLYAGLTALGGGTLRDLLLSRPIFWVRSPTYLFIALCAGSLTFLLSLTVLNSPRYFQNHLWLPDVISLATFTVVGTQVAMQQTFVLTHGILQSAGLPLLWLCSPLMGVLTGVGGGFIRDLLRRRKPFAIAHSQYPLASLAGGSLYQLARQLQMPNACAIGLTILSIVFRLSTKRSLTASNRKPLDSGLKN